MSIAISTEGMHPTTESCLEALQWLHTQGPRHHILDMGCGNGVLSVTAASIWGAQVLAVDIAPKAIDDTRHMISAYQLEELITAERSDGFSNPLIAKHSPYDLILFNMLGESITRMAADVRQNLAPDGMLILSGILAWEVEAVQSTYTTLGFEFIKDFVTTPWYSFIACHKTDI
jgi:ribosomal protein L11 methyltransferase